MEPMTSAVFLGFVGTCIGAGCLLGALVALFNSWTP